MSDTSGTDGVLVRTGIVLRPDGWHVIVDWGNGTVTILLPTFSDEIDAAACAIETSAKMKKEAIARGTFVANAW